MRSSAIRPMPTPSSTASSTTLIVLISPATACGEPARDQPQRIDPSLTNRQNQTASRTPLKRATSCRNSERHDLGMTRRHRRNQQIRRAYFLQKKPIKAICREFRLSRKVVRKVIRSEATEFHYERGRQPLPRIDPWREELDAMLLVNEGNPVRERLTLIRIFEELRGVGYEGGYDSVRRYAKAWRAARGGVTAEAYVPLSFAPGEAYQFDWSHEVVLINGT